MEWDATGGGHLDRTGTVRRRAGRRGTRAAAAAAIGLMSAAGASGATRQWVAAGDGLWATPGNWSPAGVPGAGDAVAITHADGVARTVTYDYAGPNVSIGSLSVGLTGGPAGAADTLAIPGGTLAVSGGNLSVGAVGLGTVNQTGGAVSAANGGSLVVGSAVGTGTYNLTGGTLYTYAPQVAAGSALNVTGAGILSVAALATGVNLNGGTIQTASSAYLSRLNWSSGTVTLGGTATLDGTYALGAGRTLAASNEQVGTTGVATFTLAGGTNMAGNGLTVGASQAATYVVTAGRLTAGAEYLGDVQAGTLNQSGGTNTLSNLLVGNGLVTAGVGAYTLSGGTLGAQLEDVGYQTAGTLSQTGGTNTVATFVAIDPLGAGGTYNLSGGTATVGQTVTVGVSRPSGQTAALTVGGSGTLNVAGGVTVYNAPAYSLTLSPGGTLRAGSVSLTAGNANLFRWTGGTLLVDGAGSAFGGTLAVPAGGTLGGTGTLTDAVTVAAGGVVAPGDGGSGSLTTGSLTMVATAILAETVTGPAAGTGYDPLDVNGTVVLNGATLGFTVGYAPQVGDALVVLANDGTDPIAGTFAGLPQGATFAATDPAGRPDLFRVDYAGGDGNDVALTVVAVPEPTALGLIAVLATVAAPRWRRRALGGLRPAG